MTSKYIRAQTKTMQKQNLYKKVNKKGGKKIARMNQILTVTDKKVLSFDRIKIRLPPNNAWKSRPEAGNPSKTFEQKYRNFGITTAINYAHPARSLALSLSRLFKNLEL